MAAERGLDLEELCAATSDKDAAGRELFDMEPLTVPRLCEFAAVLDVKASDIVDRALGDGAP
ncbi:hypothetical protein [Jiangella mangrovi]|uniref:XRE family transcriptional regulator n=1 Tax=Jiangella mangrovi TaxID=1524084 RepID=A0A7W9GLJ8_9ACTN|nr:hypothetical protein [Jiangella mangrovi]MBB5786000.1 hypothetical protein [Jiangella mangrovi]